MEPTWNTHGDIIISPAVIDFPLISQGNTLQTYQDQLGASQVVLVHEDGTLSAACDPRKDGAPAAAAAP
jgi:gamma-glutamyltranspeptidase